MIAKFRNFHVIIKDDDMFNEHVFNFYTIFYNDDLKTEFSDLLLAEVGENDS